MEMKKMRMTLIHFSHKDINVSTWGGKSTSGNAATARLDPNFIIGE